MNIPKPPLRKRRHSKTCYVCRHSQRRVIERRLIGGTPTRAVAAEFGLGYKAIQGHRKNCLGTMIIEAVAERRGIDFGASLLDHLERLIENFERYALKAELLGELPSAIVATREIRETLELAHELTKSLNPKVEAQAESVGSLFEKLLRDNPVIDIVVPDKTKIQ